MRKLLFLAFLGAAAWFLYTRWWPANNPQTFGGRLESAVDRELTRAGFTDRDILSQIRKEHSLWRVTWIESRKTLRVSSPEHLQDIASRLSRVAGRLDCSVSKSSRDSGTQIRIERYTLPLQTLTFVPGPQEQAGHKSRARAAFIIDDVAYETVSMDQFASLGIPLTFAILPREKHSGELARKATALHFPVMLHLPMEPKDVVHNDPGPSALMLKMTDSELKSQFDRDVASVPDIVGINNHMGSAFTEDEPHMRLVLGWIKKRNLYFLDSRTSGKSVGCKAAGAEGVPCLANQTFLDNADDVKSIEAQLDLVMNLALKRGQTIAIGHYRRKYLVQALREKIPEFQSHGVTIVALPSLYRR
jgi:polysaccharide deacetylase 2 family uncharacterized protein YibQ